MRGGGRFGFRLAAVGALLAAAACVPLVTHGPRVEPGMVLGSVVSGATDPTLVREVSTGEGNVSPVLGTMGVFVRHGWTPESAGTPVALSAGIFVPLGLPFSITHPELDLYAQLTPFRATTTAAGAGILVSRTYLTPYVQLGREVGDDASVYTTQSVAFFGPQEHGPKATVWMPNLTVKLGAVHLYAQGGLGREWMPTGFGTDSVRQVAFGMAGVIVEAPFGRRGVARGRRAPR